MSLALGLAGAPRQGRREHRKHLTRRELLMAGRRLFAEKGLYESRIEDLSRQAGIAKGTLYGYFANKEDLIEAVVTHGFNELLGHVHRAAQGSTTREEALARITEAHLAFFDDNPDLLRILHQLRGLLKFGGTEAHSLRAVLGRYLDGLADVLALHRGPSGTRSAPPRAVAMLLFGAVSGIVSVHAALGTAPPRGDAARALTRAVVEMARTYPIPGRPGSARSASPPAQAARRRARR